MKYMNIIGHDISQIITDLGDVESNIFCVVSALGFRPDSHHLIVTPSDDHCIIWRCRMKSCTVDEGRVFKNANVDRFGACRQIL